MSVAIDELMATIRREPAPPALAVVPDVEEPPEEIEPHPLDLLRARLVDSKGLDDIEEPEPLISGVLYRDTLAWLFGPPGSGKSFVALDIAACVATASDQGEWLVGASWHGFSIPRRGDVLYLVAEGVSGVKQRVRAWESSNGLAMHGVNFLPVAVQASNAAMWSTFVDLAAELRPALVVIDTQARVTVGMEENSAKEMGEFVHRAEELRAATSACVLVVHHTGRGGEHMRGSIAMDGAATTLIKIEKTDDQTISVECSKQKDAPEFDPFKLRLISHDSSAILSATSGASTVDIGRLLKTPWLAQWHTIHGTQGVSPSLLVETTDVSKRTLYRALSALVRAGLVEEQGTGPRKTYRLTRDPQT